MKDRLTILSCGNTFAVFKVKLLLVYLTDNCTIFQKNIMKRKLPVMWWQMVKPGLLDNFSMSGYMMCSPPGKRIAK